MTTSMINMASVQKVVPTGYVPRVIHVTWEGVVRVACVPAGQTGGYCKYVHLVPLTDFQRESMTPFIQYQKSVYPEETLEGGAILINITPQGLELDAAALVFRSGGGWSYHKAPPLSLMPKVKALEA